MDPSDAIAIGMPAAAGVSMAISTGDVISIGILIVLVLLSAFFFILGNCPDYGQ